MCVARKGKLSKARAKELQAIQHAEVAQLVGMQPLQQANPSNVNVCGHTPAHLLNLSQTSGLPCLPLLHPKSGQTASQELPGGQARDIISPSQTRLAPLT